MSLADISAVAGQENADMVVVFVPSYSCWVQEHTGAVRIKRYDFSFFPPSLRWVLSDLLVASLFHFSAPGIISPASWKAAVATFLRTSSQPVRKLSQRRWFVLPRMVRASCTSRSWLVGRRGSSHSTRSSISSDTRGVLLVPGASCWATHTQLLPRALYQLSRAVLVSAGTSHPHWREVPRTASWQIQAAYLLLTLEDRMKKELLISKVFSEVLFQIKSTITPKFQRKFWVNQKDFLLIFANASDKFCTVFHCYFTYKNEICWKI